ncbi:tRNA (adenosine(37)-N6)-dimethylallyltransferase MiaA [Polymorphobacter sp.]|uniref:tRNA (adenosine(37)-N6)-dimethylallyltransferase MiaA n=1 Tax=Polymorphobacter sp. TaxID=1909290 RepID=UPI003F6FFF17
MSDSGRDSGSMVALITGPSASGKSGLAVALAERLGGTIINADASQLYADLHVLSARPSAQDEARVPHRLYGIRDGADPADAADWAALAHASIADTLAQRRLPIVTGGTGLYIETLLHGIAPVPEIDAEIRAAVRALPTETAATALAAEDPEMAARLRPSDRQRLLRALEVIRATGRSLLHWQAQRTGGLADTHQIRGLVVAPDRTTRWAAAEARLGTMVAQGALEEVRALVARRLDPQLPVMKALGVAPFARALTGEISLPQACEETLIATRQYQKRQMTWLNGRLASWPRLTAAETDSAATLLAQQDS